MRFPSHLLSRLSDSADRKSYQYPQQPQSSDAEVLDAYSQAVIQVVEAAAN